MREINLNVSYVRGEDLKTLVPFQNQVLRPFTNHSQLAQMARIARIPGKAKHQRY